MEKNLKTLYCGNLADVVTEELLYELFLQAGPVEEVKIVKDKNGKSRGFGFVTFKHAVSVPYAVQLMAGESLFGRALRMQERGSNPGSPVVHHNGHQKSNTFPPGFNSDNRNGSFSPNYSLNTPNNYSAPALKNFTNANGHLSPNFGSGGGSVNISPNNGYNNGPGLVAGYLQMNNGLPVLNGIRPLDGYPNYVIPIPPSNFMSPGKIHCDMDRRPRLSLQRQEMRPMQYQYTTPAKMQQDKLRFRDTIQQHWKASRR